MKAKDLVDNAAGRWMVLRSSKGDYMGELQLQDAIMKQDDGLFGQDVVVVLSGPFEARLFPDDEVEIRYDEGS